MGGYSCFLSSSTFCRVSFLSGSVSPLAVTAWTFTRCSREVNWSFTANWSVWAATKVESEGGRNDTNPEAELGTIYKYYADTIKYCLYTIHISLRYYKHTEAGLTEVLPCALLAPVEPEQHSLLGLAQGQRLQRPHQLLLGYPSLLQQLLGSKGARTVI